MNGKDMDSRKSDAPKTQEMVMCGDHPSFTKSELNAKEMKSEDKDRDLIREAIPMSYTRISPTVSRTARAASEHALRLAAARRAHDPPPHRSAGDEPQRGTRALVQAALGSFRWPPYLVALWVLVLAVTHALHALVAVLERALPTVKKFCQYFRSWTEESWKGEGERSPRVFPLALACACVLLYAAYGCLCVLHAVALWAVEPRGAIDEEKRSEANIGEVKVTDYVNPVNSNTNSSTKHCPL